VVVAGATTDAGTVVGLLGAATVVLTDRDSAAGSLTFTGTILADSFTANNSVLNGINLKPNQQTGGEGPITGTEAQFGVTFTTPIALPALQEVLW